MADEKNIDEILKSIDALLKEGGLENPSNKGAAGESSNTRADIATNDDEVPDFEISDAFTSIEDEADETDEPAVEAYSDEEAEPDEQQSEEDVQTGDTQAEEVQVEDVQTEVDSETDALSGQAIEQEHAVKRIVLSESMVVEDAPDLAFVGTEASIEENQPENGMLGEVYSDEPNSDDIALDDLSEDEVQNSAEYPESEDVALTELPESEEDDAPLGDAPELDMDALVEQITSEISARLQQQLPGMVAGMVAEALQKNLVAHASTDNESTDDTQN